MVELSVTTPQRRTGSPETGGYQWENALSEALQKFLGPNAAPQNPNVPQTIAERYPDTWRTIAEQIGEGRGPSSVFGNLLANFRGGMDMSSFLDWAGPWLATTLYDSPGYRFSQDPANWDKTMQSYGMGAGMIGEGARQGLTQGQQQLARSGLGRSGAMAALASEAQSRAATGQANLWTQLQQQSVQNKLAAARQAYDLDRDIMGLALGVRPYPRYLLEHEQGGGGIGRSIGTIAGTLAGIGASFIPGVGGLGAAAGAAGAGSTTAAAGSTLPGRLL